VEEPQSNGEDQLEREGLHWGVDRLCNAVDWVEGSAPSGRRAIFGDFLNCSSVVDWLHRRDRSGVECKSCLRTLDRIQSVVARCRID
jgi:hypothetical protein